MTGHRSVYPSQVLSITKSPSILIKKGIEMDDLNSIEIHPRPRSIIDILIRAKNRLKELKNNIMKK